jgi:hypothetical protein
MNMKMQGPVNVERKAASLQDVRRAGVTTHDASPASLSYLFLACSGMCAAHNRTVRGYAAASVHRARGPTWEEPAPSEDWQALPRICQMTL